MHSLHLTHRSTFVGLFFIGSSVKFPITSPIQIIRKYNENIVRFCQIYWLKGKGLIVDILQIPSEGYEGNHKGER